MHVVIKTRHVESLIDDLCLTLNNLRAYDIKLNPKKCVFGIPAGKLLAFIIFNRGIEEIRPKSERTLSRSKNSLGAWRR